MERAPKMHIIEYHVIHIPLFSYSLLAKCLILLCCSLPQICASSIVIMQQSSRSLYTEKQTDRQTDGQNDYYNPSHACD